MKPLISIIIPAYNAESYIERCIDSVLNQVNNNIEIVIVNDGSTDNTQRILDSYKMKYPDTIKVFKQKNKGEGEARNTGISKANGKYFTFVDADDYLKPSAIKKFVPLLSENPDIILGGFETKAKGETILHVPKDTNQWTLLKYPCTAFKCNKKSFVTDNQLKYKPYKISCDVLFNVVAFSKTNNILFTGSSDYVNEINDTSSTANIGKQALYDIIDVIREIDKNINKDVFKNKFLTFFYMKCIVNNLIIQIDKSNTKNLNSLYKSNYNWLKKNKSIKLQYIKGETFPINCIVNLFIIFSKVNMQLILITLLKLFIRK